MQDANFITQMNDLFNPRSIAIVGLPRGMKSGKLFLISLLEMGYPGPIYPVHPTAGEIDGLTCYPSVSAIPGPVDQAIVLVPHDGAMAVLEDCAAKGVQSVVLFTAGYKELGTPEGRAEEEAIVRLARDSGMRIMGPNCMGLYVPKTGLSFFPGLSRTPGHVAVISHSGSLANMIGRNAEPKGIRFSKAISLGNECDLKAVDFLNYLAQDKDTHVIGAYIESISDGPVFLDALRRTSLKKPVILWKAGLTPEGGRAASSHTGALAGSGEVWRGVVRQGGGVPVIGWEAWIDAMMAFSMLPDGLGDRIAILSGPGGLAVSTAEAVGLNGMRLAEIAPETRTALARVVPPTGTSLNNPIDVGLSASMELNIYNESARALDSDPNVDAIVVVGAGIDERTSILFADCIIGVGNVSEKPILVVRIPGLTEVVGRKFCDAGIPYFETADRAMRTYAQALEYQRWRRSRACPAGSNHERPLSARLRHPA
ncbi:MAG: CoA-binding protein [Proteobacteria bacterium]|nr:CoA-binding protein [Pseudomonadota bacterium]